MDQSTSSASVAILLEALPYIRRFYGSTIVIKIGGAAMEDLSLRKDFARDVVLLQYVGIKPVIVHGGGLQISRMLGDLSIPTEFIDGHRITDEASMAVVEMVLSGKINKEMVALVNAEGGRSVGISGKDGNLANAVEHSIERVHSDGRKESISLGKVGKVSAKDIHPDLIFSLEKSGYVPIIAPIATDLAGQVMNINADTMAGAIAAALEAKKLILLTDIPGVIVNDKPIQNLYVDDLPQLKRDKQITGGMLPKVDCCVEAINAGVKQAHIIDGRTPHALLLEIFTDRGVGTMISHQ